MSSEYHRSSRILNGAAISSREQAPLYPSYSSDLELLAKLGQVSLIFFVILAIVLIVFLLVNLFRSCFNFGQKKPSPRYEDNFGGDAGQQDGKDRRPLPKTPGRSERHASGPESQAGNDDASSKNRSLSYYYEMQNIARTSDIDDRRNSKRRS